MVTLTSAYQLLGESEYTTFLSAYNGRVALRMYARLERQDTESNKSYVWIRLARNIIGDYSNVGYSYGSASASMSGSLNDTWADGARGTTYVGEHTIFERSYAVSHNDEGKCTLTLSAKYDDSYIAERSIYAASCALPDIPRKSEIASVTFVDNAIERGFSVSFTPASTSFTHRVEVIADGEAVLSRENYSAGSDISLTADELLDLYRKKVTDVTVRLITQSGGKDIGMVESSQTLEQIGNAYIKTDGAWRRGVIHVGSNPGVVMVKADGEWRLAR